MLVGYPQRYKQNIKFHIYKKMGCGSGLMQADGIIMDIKMAMWQDTDHEEQASEIRHQNTMSQKKEAGGKSWYCFDFASMYILQLIYRKGFPSEERDLDQLRRQRLRFEGPDIWRLYRSTFKDGQSSIYARVTRVLVLNAMSWCQMAFPEETRTDICLQQIGHQGYTKEMILSKSSLKNNEFIGLSYRNMEEEVLTGYGNSKTTVPLKSLTPAQVLTSGDSIMESCLHTIYTLQSLSRPPGAEGQRRTMVVVPREQSWDSSPPHPSTRDCKQLPYCFQRPSNYCIVLLILLP